MTSLRNRLLNSTASVLAVLGFLAVANPACAAGYPAELDPGFGDQGVVRFGTPEARQQITACLPQPDGKIVIGVANAGQAKVGRLNADGSPDAGFNGSGLGVAITHFDGVFGPYVAVGTDGKVFTAGVLLVLKDPNAPVLDSFAYVKVTRFNSDGTLDTTYGTGGSALVLPGDGGMRLAGILVQPDGKAVVYGDFSAHADYNNFDNYVIRLNEGGSLDSGFGYNGIFTHGQGTDQNEYANGAVLQPDGKIVLGVVLDHAYFGTVGKIVRLTATGQLDGSFSNGGVLLVDDRNFSSMALQPDGKIVFGRPTPMRLNPDGTVDSSFSNIPGGNYVSSDSVTVQGNGKILSTASSAGGGGYLVRSLADGTQDPDFRDAGGFSISLPDMGDAPQKNGVGVQADGKILVCGFSGYTVKGFVARYLGDSAANTSSTPVTTGPSDIDRVLNWAEATFPSEFSPAATSQTVTGYYFRYYPVSNSYLASYQNDGRLYYLGHLSNWQIYDAGALADWLLQAQAAGF